MPRIAVFHADNLAVLQALPDACVDLIYIDPPFNTGKVQQRTQLATVRDDNGDRVGFKGQVYRTIKGQTRGYDDRFEDFMGFIYPRMVEAYRILSPRGSLFFHLDYREIHYCKVMLDGIFGRDSFINEIIWAYDYGARSRCRWSAKHDNILWYAKDPENYTFNFEEMDRIPYMAPALVGPSKAALGKTPTDVWWHTIVSPNGREKTGYATQKPRGIIDRIVKVHSRPGDILCDFFAGSGTLGESAVAFGRSAVLVDKNLEAIHVMKKRFEGLDTVWKRGASHTLEVFGELKGVAQVEKMEAEASAKVETRPERRDVIIRRRRSTPESPESARREENPSSPEGAGERVDAGAAVPAGKAVKPAKTQKKSVARKRNPVRRIPSLEALSAALAEKERKD